MFFFYLHQDEAKSRRQSEHEDVVMEARVRARNGSVLGKGSILKMYFFPGQKKSTSMNFHGTPHVFKVCFLCLKFTFLRLALCSIVLLTICTSLKVKRKVTHSMLIPMVQCYSLPVRPCVKTFQIQVS